MATQHNDELLIPPTVSVGIVVPPAPSIPPTKDDVERALRYKNKVESTLSCMYNVSDALAEVMNVIRALDAKFDTRFTDLDRKFNRLDSKFNQLDRKFTDQFNQLMTGQVDMTGVLVQNMVSGRATVIASYRDQAIVRILRAALYASFHISINSHSQATNRNATARNQPGVEVPFLDGTSPSSTGLPVVRDAAGIGRLNVNQAREYAAGHGWFGDVRTAAGIKDRLRAELGFAQQ
ncbi:hypothetical protein V1508DRAFT_358546 [Lipomyces doorenjongii]|uniref:uncharacterized protein n=1 Tax=Lipomyces doorenjongii TaxID=383834 RepID=UPI0034CDA6A1